MEMNINRPVHLLNVIVRLQKNDYSLSIYSTKIYIRLSISMAHKHYSNRIKSIITDHQPCTRCTKKKHDPD